LTAVITPKGNGELITPVDYDDSANRHWEDADYLFADNRLANADQLFGLSAECALKTIMERCVMTLRLDGAPQDIRHKIHINKLWDEFQTFANNITNVKYANNAMKYAKIALANPNPFHDWDIAQRYCHRSDIVQQNVDQHKQDALLARQILQLAILDGVV